MEAEEAGASVMFDRARNPDSHTVQVKFECRKSTLQWLDAISMSKDQHRGTLINEILEKWADEERHKHMIVSRVVAGNPTDSDTQVAA